MAGWRQPGGEVDMIIVTSIRKLSWVLCAAQLSETKRDASTTPEEVDKEEQQGQ